MMIIEIVKCVTTSINSCFLLIEIRSKDDENLEKNLMDNFQVNRMKHSFINLSFLQIEILSQ